MVARVGVGPIQRPRQLRLVATQQVQGRDVFRRDLDVNRSIHVTLDTDVYPSKLARRDGDRHTLASLAFPRRRKYRRCHLIGKVRG